MMVCNAVSTSGPDYGYLCCVFSFYSHPDE
jgi:hypothetical protein